jgi:hypothetical protein
VLGEEEARQQRVDPQQPLARQRHLLGVGPAQVAVAAQRAQLALEAPQHVQAVLVAEVGGPDRAPLELQHELAERALVAARPVRAAERQLAASDHRDVGFPGVEVLHVDAVHVPE